MTHVNLCVCGSWRRNTNRSGITRSDLLAFRHFVAVEDSGAMHRNMRAETVSARTEGQTL
jgi:hypothetical protein